MLAKYLINQRFRTQTNPPKGAIGRAKSGIGHTPEACGQHRNTLGKRLVLMGSRSRCKRQ